MRHLFAGDSASAALEGPTHLGEFDALRLAFFNDVTLELCDSANEHQDGFQCARDVLSTFEVQPFLYGLERNTALRPFLGQPEQIASTETVSAVTENHVAITNLVKDPAELWTLRVLTGGEVDEEPGALIGKRFFLAGGVLIVQTHADIAEDMCHECSIKVSIQTLVHHCTIRVDCRQQGAVFECSIRC